MHLGIWSNAILRKQRTGEKMINKKLKQKIFLFFNKILVAVNEVN
jgi:hypothetical protein